jgi:polyisoprenyl-teichoic acid--peptidoglycan teichoic acid transferase
MKEKLHMPEAEPTKQPLRPARPTKKKRNSFRWFIYLLIIGGILFVSFTVKASFTNDESVWSNLLAVTDRYIHPTLSLGDSLAALTADANKTLTGMEEDRVNILLMGIGGSGHDGGNLTDTIIVVSYKPSTNEASMMSIPRDLIVPIPGYGWRKINNLYSLAEYNDPGTGGDYSKQIISQIFGVQIPYFVRVDFKGFQEILDLVGGVDVDVPTTLSDYQYPIAGREDYPEDQRYEHLLIEQGEQHFDGKTALKYVRSRHALGGEGSDFARAARQQLVIDALMDKMLSFSTLLQPGKIKRIINNVQENLDTNLALDEMVAFAKLAKEYKNVEQKPEMTTVVLDNDVDGPLQAANYNGAFVLEPKVDDFSELKFIAQNIFTPELEYQRPSSETGLPRVTLENPVEATEEVTIEIQNGTFVNGLARATQEKLDPLGYEVIAISNTDIQNFTETVVYDFSDGGFPKTLDFLAGNYTDNISSSIPLGISSEADILIILGLDSAY